MVDYSRPSQTSPRRDRPVRRQRITGLQILFIAILAIGMLLTINFSARISRGQQYNDLQIQVEGTIDALRAENIELRQELEFVQSDAAVEDWAHRDGKMVRPGEILVIPVPGLVLPTATPIATAPPLDEPVEPDIPSTDLWWSLFFDSEPPW